MVMSGILEDYESLGREKNAQDGLMLETRQEGTT